MSSKRRKTAGFVPVNNLFERNRMGSGQLRGGYGPVKRHTIQRDPDVVAKIDSGSIGQEILAQDVRDGTRELHVIDEVPRVDSGGLLVDTDQNTNNVSYTISGRISNIDSHNNVLERSKCLLIFRNDYDGPRICFKFQEQDIKNAYIDPQKDCQVILFDQEDLTIAFVLHKSRLIRIDTRTQATRNGDSTLDPTYVILWESTDSTKISRIRENLKQFQTCKIKVEASAESLMRNLSEYSVNETKSTPFLKKNLSSLERIRHSTQPSHAAHRIQVPSSPERPDTTKKMREIKPAGFYSKLTDHAFSRTRSQTPNLVQSKLFSIDDDKDFETPEKFTPRLCYKFDDGAGYTITNQDFKCLYNHDWINDTILDFFTKYYVERAIKESIIKREKVHIMSSFFYTKLISDPTDYYANVQNWVTNCDLFNKQYVVVPINMNFHWFGCIITNLDAILRFFEKLSDNEKAKLARKPKDEPKVSPSPAGQDIISRLSSRSTTPLVAEEEDDDDSVSVSAPIIRILTFDSLRQTHSREIDPIKDFLIAYAKDKYGIDLDKSLIKMRTCAVPQQPNMSDCGVHVILNTMKFFENPMSTIEVWRSAKSKSKVSSRIINEYFERNKRSSARRDLRDVLWALQKEQIKTMEENNENPLQGDSSRVEEDEEDGDIEILEDLSKFQASLPQQKDTTSNLEAQQQRIEGPAKKKAQQENEQIMIESFNGGSTFKESSELPKEFRRYESPDDKSRVASSSMDGPSNRKYLESSPIRSSGGKGEATASGITSPYFGTSSLKGRSDAFESSGMKPLSSPIFIKPRDGNDDKHMTQPPSSILSEFPIAEADEREQSESSSFSDADESRVTISDKVNDSDVNLLGYSDRGSSTQLRKDVEAELNEPIIGETIDQNYAGNLGSYHSEIARKNVRDSHHKFQDRSAPDFRMSEKLSPDANDDVQSIASESD